MSPTAIPAKMARRRVVVLPITVRLRLVIEYDQERGISSLQGSTGGRIDMAPAVL